MKVFLVVLNWNGKDDTAACLASLAEARVPGEVALTTLVVDNGSTDGSLETLPARFPNVRFVPMGENLRWAGGNNRGLSTALGEGADFVLLLNNDTVVDPGFLAPLLRAVKAEPRGGIFGPTILSMDGGKVWSAGGGWSPWLGWAWHRGLGRPWRGPDGPEVQASGYVTGAALMVTKGCVERIGLLDEGYYLYGEDADWCLRAREAGFACLYVAPSVVQHRVSGSSGAASPFKAYHRTRAGLRLAARHAKPWHWLTWPWISTLLLFAQSVAWAMRGGGAAVFRAAWRAWADHWAGRPMAHPAYAPKRGDG